jgi:hypothetical protein
MNSRRSARLHAREQQRKRDVRQRYVQMGIGVAAAVVVVIGIGLFVVNRASAQPGRAVPNQGQTHIDKGQQHVAYNSKPPTSGPHWNLAGEAPVNWGIYTDPIPDEGQIHNLEHGGIMIQYNCRDCPELVAQLTDFYNSYVPTHKLPLFQNSSKIVIAPYYDMPNRIALTAWTRIDSFDTYDEERITKFVEAWRDKGPEVTP